MRVREKAYSLRSIYQPGKLSAVRAQRLDFIPKRLGCVLFGRPKRRRKQQARFSRTAGLTAIPMEKPVSWGKTEVAICRLHVGLTLADDLPAPFLGLLFRFDELPGSVANRAFHPLPRLVSRA